MVLYGDVRWWPPYRHLVVMWDTKPFQQGASSLLDKQHFLRHACEPYTCMPSDGSCTQPDIPAKIAMKSQGLHPCPGAWPMCLNS